MTSRSPDEARLVLDIRESVPLPANGKILQKILSQRMLDDLLAGRWSADDTVGGFVARAADAQKLVTSSDIAHGFGLDYGPGRTIPAEFLDANGTVGDVFAVRFAMSDVVDLRVPARDAGDQAGLLFGQDGKPYYHPSSVAPLGPDNPYHGNGFVGTGELQIIPEYHMPDYAPALRHGTEVWRITPAGDEVLYAARINNQWVRF